MEKKTGGTSFGGPTAKTGKGGGGRGKKEYPPRTDQGLGAGPGRKETGTVMVWYFGV